MRAPAPATILDNMVSVMELLVVLVVVGTPLAPPPFRWITPVSMRSGSALALVALRQDTVEIVGPIGVMPAPPPPPPAPRPAPTKRP